jgi:hypothetical protein
MVGLVTSRLPCVTAPGSTPLSERDGEDKANVIRWRPLALRTCTVSFSGPSGVRHSVDVTAESIYESAALAVSALKNSACVDAIGPGMELEIQRSLKPVIG